MRMTPGRCCCGSSDCVIFAWPNGINDPFEPLTDHFDVVSGTWSLVGGGLTESTGSGILLAKNASATGTEHILPVLFGTTDSSKFDVVFDYIDSSNYQVLKFRGSSPRNCTIARVSSGVETDVDSIADSATQDHYTFVRNTTNVWVVTSQILARSTSTTESHNYFYDLAAYGGTRFGLRSNNGGNTSIGVESFWCVESQDTQVDTLYVYDPTTNNEINVESPVGQPGCAVNPNLSRCDDCLALAPANGEAQWKLTVSGISGTYGTLLNGTIYINPGTFGSTGMCLATQVNNYGGAYSQVWYQVNLNELIATSSIAATTYGVRIGAYDGISFHWCYLKIPTRYIDCYTDWPQTLTLWDYDNTADIDYSGVSATLELA